MKREEETVNPALKSYLINFVSLCLCGDNNIKIIFGEENKDV